MTRGTTPQIRIKLKNCDVGLLSSIYITFVQAIHEKKVLEKAGDEITVDESENMLIVSLTQEETLLFDAVDVKLQIRAVTVNGQAVASEILNLPVNRILKDGVIE